jgi:hypothetical protein
MLLLEFEFQIVSNKSKIQMTVNQEYLHTFFQLLILFLKKLNLLNVFNSKYFKCQAKSSIALTQ